MSWFIDLFFTLPLCDDLGIGGGEKTPILYWVPMLKITWECEYATFSRKDSIWFASVILVLSICGTIHVFKRSDRKKSNVQSTGDPSPSDRLSNQTCGYDQPWIRKHTDESLTGKLILSQQNITIRLGGRKAIKKGTIAGEIYLRIFYLFGITTL